MSLTQIGSDILDKYSRDLTYSNRQTETKQVRQDRLLKFSDDKLCLQYSFHGPISNLKIIFTGVKIY